MEELDAAELLPAPVPVAWKMPPSPVEAYETFSGAGLASAISAFMSANFESARTARMLGARDTLITVVNDLRGS